MHALNISPALRLRWLVLALAAAALLALFAIGLVTSWGYEGMDDAAGQVMAACMSEQTALLKQALDAGEPAFAPHERCGVEFLILLPAEHQEVNDAGR